MRYIKKDISRSTMKLMIKLWYTGMLSSALDILSVVIRYKMQRKSSKAKEEKKITMKELYLLEACREGVDLNSFRAGHLSGPEGFLEVMESKAALSVPFGSKQNKKLLPNILAGLKTKFYDGKSLDSIIREVAGSFGECVRLQRSIVQSDSVDRLLSYDGLYSLPNYAHREVDTSSCRLGEYGEIFKMTNKSELPRSRENIINFLKLHNVCMDDVDGVISYLVTMRYL
jgi:hypothetical protein